MEGVVTLEIALTSAKLNLVDLVVVDRHLVSQKEQEL
jgi:hypothetical protein